MLVILKNIMINVKWFEFHENYVEGLVCMNMDIMKRVYLNIVEMEYYDLIKNKEMELFNNRKFILLTWFDVLNF